MKALNKHWSRIAACSAFIGILCILSAVSTSDYYVLELGQEEPAYIGKLMVIGLALLFPAIAKAITLYIKGE